LEAAQAFGVIESVKTASDLYAPAAGEVIEVNAALAEKPELVNEDPYGGGWMIRMRLADPGSVGSGDGLMEAAAYRTQIEAG
jgi:glycine cleavage system H protein